MARLLLLLGLIALTVYIIKKLYLPKPEEKQQQPQLMKKCSKCSTYIPENQTIQHDELFFCSETHRREFLNQ